MSGGGYGLFASPATPEDRGNGAAGVGGVETLPRFGLTSITGVSGQLWIAYVTAAASGPIGRLMVATGDTAGASITLARAALFTTAADGSITKVAQTASDATVGAGQFTPYERAFATAGGFPATYPIARGRRYALGFLMVAGTPANLQGAFVLDAATAPVPTRIIGGQADIAASYAVGALSAHFTMLYVRGLPPA
jgi:hypothetical protein